MKRLRSMNAWPMKLLCAASNRTFTFDHWRSFTAVAAMLMGTFTLSQVVAAPPAHQDRQVLVPKSKTVRQPVAVHREQHSQAAPKMFPAKNTEPSSRVKPSLVKQAAHEEIIQEMPPKLVRSSAVQQASYGCDCGQCVGEPSCGYEVGCGAESCGIAGCGGCEPACGSESFMDASCGCETSGAGGCDACGVSSCGGQCMASCTMDTYNFCLPIFRIEWCRFEFFAGVNGFTGPANYANTSAPTAGNPATSRSGSSSFGFYEGFNEGRSLKRLFGLDLSSQFGLRATQSSLSGAEFTQESRKQIFLTGGLFRRVDFGLQYGVVVDYLNDEWWYDNDLVQLRGELSWNDGCNHQFGYQFMVGLDDSTSSTDVVNAAGTRFLSTVSFEPTDQHRFFFRGPTVGGGNFNVFLGGTNQSDFLLGAGLTTVVRRGLAFQAGSTFLVPGEDAGIAGGNENEGWNLSMGIVYRPGGRTACGPYCRPMFDVADNGTFMIDRL